MNEKLEKIRDYRPASAQFDSNKQMSQKSEQMAEKKPEESSSMQKRVKDMQKLLNPSKFN
jgi:hypothetical protein